jgi:hypothetical protein
VEKLSFLIKNKINNMGLFRKYRIKEVNGKFIPQVREDILSSWGGIGDDGYIWNTERLQIEYCGLNTKEDAIKVIDEHLMTGKIHKYPKDKTWYDEVVEFFTKKIK